MDSAASTRSRVWRSRASTMSRCRATPRRAVSWRTASSASLVVSRSAVGTGSPMSTKAVPTLKVAGSWNMSPMGKRVARLSPSSARRSRAAPVRRGMDAGLGGAPPSGKDQDPTPRLQSTPSRAEHRLVVHGAPSFVLASVHGDGSGQPCHLADERIAEERRLGDGAKGTRKGGGEEQSVHQPLLMVGGYEERPGAGDPLRADHVDAPIEEGDEDAGDPAEEPGGAGLSHGRKESGPRSPEVGRSRVLPLGRTTGERASPRGEIESLRGRAFHPTS